MSNRKTIVAFVLGATMLLSSGWVSVAGAEDSASSGITKAHQRNLQSTAEGGTVTFFSVPIGTSLPQGCTVFTSHNPGTQCEEIECTDQGAENLNNPYTDSCQY